MSRNDITGDDIRSKIGDQKAFENGWERIYGKKNKEPVFVRVPAGELDRPCPYCAFLQFSKGCMDRDCEDGRYYFKEETE